MICGAITPATIAKKSNITSHERAEG